MPTTILEYKKILLACVSLISLSLALGLGGYGYKQVKDANFLNVDVNKILVVDGYAEVDTTMDRAVISFQISGMGDTAELAREDLNKNFSVLSAKLDGKVKAGIVKLDQGVPYEGEKEKFVVTDFYEATIDKFTIDEINVFSSKIWALPNYNGSISSTYYTLIEKNGPFKKITDAAIQDAKKTAETIAASSGVRLGKVKYVNIGNWDETTSSYTFNNAQSLYTGYSPQGKVRQTAHITYELR